MQYHSHSHSHSSSSSWFIDSRRVFTVHSSNVTVLYCTHCTHCTHCTVGSVHFHHCAYTVRNARHYGTPSRFTVRLSFCVTLLSLLHAHPCLSLSLLFSLSPSFVHSLSLSPSTPTFLPPFPNNTPKVDSIM